MITLLVGADGENPKGGSGGGSGAV